MTVTRIMINITLASIIISALVFPAYGQELPTNGTFKSRIGKLEVINGYPANETIDKLYDELDFQRAVQVYLWGLPTMAMWQWQLEQRDKFGTAELDYADYIDFKDKLGLLTANAVTPYSMAFPNLERTGPLVLEIPPGPSAGGILDFWQRPLSDTGQLGPDKAKGGKFLVLGPTHPDMNPEGYYVLRSPTNNIWSGQRALSPDLKEAAKWIAGLKIYPYNEGDKKLVSKHVPVEGRKWTGEQPRGMAYWEGLANLINEEPTHERDRMMLAMLVPLGIEKGKEFAPNERQKKILTEAAAVGELMARAIAYEKRFPGAQIWPGKQWAYSLFLKETHQEATHHTQLDERISWFYEAVGVSVGMMGRTVGAGQVYLEASKDSLNNWLDGRKHYTLHVTKNQPVAQFWSLTVYDVESRCLIDTGMYPDRSSRNDIVKNPDGSVDLYFGPTPPAGKPESNWIKTLQNKGWFTYFRLYGPTEPYFDKTWQLPDIKEMTQ